MSSGVKVQATSNESTNRCAIRKYHEENAYLKKIEQAINQKLILQNSMQTKGYTVQVPYFYALALVTTPIVNALENPNLIKCKVVLPMRVENKLY